MPAPSGLRVGDADRAATAASLREHYADGRLTLEEFQQRLDASFAAKTDHDLARLTHDLPYADGRAGEFAIAGQPPRALSSGLRRTPVLRGISAVAVAVAIVVLAAVLMRFALVGLWLLIRPVLIVLAILLIGRRGLRRYARSGTRWGTRR